MGALHRGRGLGERGVVANAPESLSDTNNISLDLILLVFFMVWYGTMARKGGRLSGGR